MPSWPLSYERPGVRHLVWLDRPCVRTGGVAHAGATLGCWRGGQVWNEAQTGPQAQGSPC